MDLFGQPDPKEPPPRRLLSQSKERPSCAQLTVPEYSGPLRAYDVVREEGPLKTYILHRHE